MCNYIQHSSVFFFILIFTLGCDNPGNKTQTTDAVHSAETKSSDYQVLQTYLNKHIVKPNLDTSILYSLDLDYNEIINLTYKEVNIQWKREETDHQITVNGLPVNLKDFYTLNNVWGNSQDSLFGNRITNIKFYDHKDEELIVLTYNSIPCSGLGCSVSNFVVHDINKEETSYFGTFKTGMEFELHDFTINDQINYLGKTYFGRNKSQIDTTLYELYSLIEGKFAKTTTKDSLWIRNIYPEHQDTSGRIESNWFEEIE